MAFVKIGFLERENRSIIIYNRFKRVVVYNTHFDQIQVWSTTTSHSSPVGLYQRNYEISLNKEYGQYKIKTVPKNEEISEYYHVSKIITGNQKYTEKISQSEDKIGC